MVADAADPRWARGEVWGRATRRPPEGGGVPRRVWDAPTQLVLAPRAEEAGVGGVAPRGVDGNASVSE